MKFPWTKEKGNEKAPALKECPKCFRKFPLSAKFTENIAFLDEQHIHEAPKIYRFVCADCGKRAVDAQDLLLKRGIPQH